MKSGSRWRLAAPAVAALCLGALTAPMAAAHDPTHPDHKDKARHLGHAIGQAYVCTPEEGKAAAREQAKMVYATIVADVGAEVAYSYALAVGYSAGQPAVADCAKVLAHVDSVMESMAAHAGVH